MIFKRKFSHQAPCWLAASLFIAACSSDPSTAESVQPNAQPTSGSVSVGLGQTTTANIFANGRRLAPLGKISDNNGTVWPLPAAVRYNDSSMPVAPDLYNSYVSGHSYKTSTEALAALDPENIIEIDAAGEVVTAYIFADNYFEMYVNGVAVAKDPVPFTDFNSNLLQFRVKKPFNVAMLLVDWEENLGTGTEANRGSAAHPGDGGLVAVFKDATGASIGITDNSWKAQTYYTAPLLDTSCLSEANNQRLSGDCGLASVADLNTVMAAHWPRPEGWTESAFDDSNWPSAVEFTNDTVGVDNKPSYTNFRDIFDDPKHDAQFLWSSNLVLDNEVLVRGIVGQ